MLDMAKQDREYVEACLHPGRKRVVPPFSNATEIAGIIPLALTATMYTNQAYTTSATQAGTIATSLTPLGSSEHTVIALCPAATCFGSNGANTFASGISITNPGAPVGLNAPVLFYSLYSFFPMNQPVYSELPMTSVWGSDLSDIGVHGNAFSIEYEVKVVAAAANIGGFYFQTTIPIGTLIKDDGSLASISLDELIRNGEMHSMDNGKLVVNEFIRNPNVLVEIHRNGSQVDWGSILGECITFVIIPRASIPIATTSSTLTATYTPFSLSATSRANFIVWPKATPAGMALAEKPKVVHAEYEVHHASAAARYLKNKRVAKVPEKGWVGKTWDYIKDVDWKKWASIATTLGSVLLEEEPSS